MKNKKIHFVGVGGVGMGTLATALSASGYEISGSDGVLYEPMKSVLLNAKIKLIEGYHAETPQKIKPDFVVIGNVVRKENPEVQSWLKSEIPFYSFPEAIRNFLIQDKASIVCAGTHGKTTTTSWISFLLKELGLNPSYLIGGVPINLENGCTLTDSPYFVVEGDEYDSAFFDKGPKFLHYKPKYLILSSIEFDHADIYKDLDHVKSSFKKLINILPGDGLCIARAEDNNIAEVIKQALCPIQTFGLSENALWQIGKVEESTTGFHFEILYKKRSVGFFDTPMFGEHNLVNLLSGIALAVNLGQSIENIRSIVPKFLGAKRRQEILLTEPYLLVDDFAHHPTEVTATLKAVKRRFPAGKLFALFEPRSATARRSIHQEEYPKAFEVADEIYICAPYRATELNQEERFSADKLVADLVSKGKTAKTFASAEEIVSHLISTISKGDKIVVMSNGEFGKIQEKLLKKLCP